MNRKASSACAASSKARDAYLNRRACSRIFNPQPATGGFPYNRRSVAECDPSRLKCDRHVKPEEYGYDA